MKPQQLRLLLSVIGVFCTIPNAAGNDYNASNDLINEIHQLPFDANQNLGDHHYIITNEDRHDLYIPAIRDLGGVYLGVGSNQNYEMIGWAKPTFAVLIDFDQMVVDIHKLYKVAFEHAESPDQFIEFWSSGQSDRLRQFVRAAFPDDRQFLAVMKARRYAGQRIYKKLQRTQRRHKRQKLASYLTDAGQYGDVRRQVQTGHVIAIRGDFTGTKTMRALGDLLKKHRQTVRVFYISNCEQYFKYDSNFRHNINSLPVDTASLILRTRVWREFLPSTQEPKGPQRYTYIHQPLVLFQAWLKRSKTRDVKGMIGLPRETKKSLLFDRKPPRK